MEKRLGKENSSARSKGETIRLRDNEPVTILGIPDIVVLETVDVDVQTVRIHVHVGHEIA